MENIRYKTATYFDLAGKIGSIYRIRLYNAQKAYLRHMQKAVSKISQPDDLMTGKLWHQWASYMTDFSQKTILFWDVLRERGNSYIDHKKKGSPPLFAFKWEMIADGRSFERPVNHALVRFIPPEGVIVDNSKRPLLILDPRAGHGPGVGGFKKDSEVGVALELGHPVYFAIFFQQPEPDQTIIDVCDAETKFIKIVMERHPDSPKPVLYGNCQGGWASMLISSRNPGMAGPVVLSGSPMSYWSGSWSMGEGENPMRYSGGLLGGSWPALLACDLGCGKFDGVYLVENFENLNPANTLWKKYYTLWKQIDTERERFLDFEKWWGAFYSMNEQEIHWIIKNLFIGNKLARGDVKAAPGEYIDLKAIRSPIVIFSSRGDNITPPQQAINWISDVYSSTDEIKANGQTIVLLVHENIGHLGIFVAGKVVRKEHQKIIENFDLVEKLRPGLYRMNIVEKKAGRKKDKYIAKFQKIRLEDLREFNRFNRMDEKPFELVDKLSAINEKKYVRYGRPLVKKFANKQTALIGSNFHPLRMQRWMLSDINPCMWPLQPMAQAVRKFRKPPMQDNPWYEFEGLISEGIAASLNLYRDLRDATYETIFYQIYGIMPETHRPVSKRAAAERGKMLELSLKQMNSDSEKLSQRKAVRHEIEI